MERTGRGYISAFPQIKERTDCLSARVYNVNSGEYKSNEYCAVVVLPLSPKDNKVKLCQGIFHKDCYESSMGWQCL